MIDGDTDHERSRITFPLQKTAPQGTPLNPTATENTYTTLHFTTASHTPILDTRLSNNGVESFCADRNHSTSSSSVSIIYMGSNFHISFLLHCLARKGKTREEDEIPASQLLGSGICLGYLRESITTAWKIQKGGSPTAFLGNLFFLLLFV